ncbi:MAG: cupin domain-containing protein [Acidimicrobiales bacterium]|nr:cupin domain-containing protein [Acidimicrobiales bacterium]
MIDPTVAALVEHFGMTRLPVEDTFFVSTHRSATELPDGGPVGTAMIGLYSAEPPSRSLFHRLTADETWHFYGGDPIRLVVLHPDGSSAEVVLGADVLAGQRVQHVIPAGTWQAGELVPGGRWALFGCTMAPGFTSTCFEGGRVGTLLDSHPDRADDIARLGVPDTHPTRMPDDLAT